MSARATLCRPNKYGIGSLRKHFPLPKVRKNVPLNPNRTPKLRGEIGSAVGAAERAQTFSTFKKTDLLIFGFLALVSRFRPNLALNPAKTKKFASTPKKNCCFGLGRFRERSVRPEMESTWKNNPKVGVVIIKQFVFSSEIINCVK